MERRRPTHDPDQDLEILKKRTRLDLSLNEVRIVVGCLEALAYQAEIDDEPYLDPDALALKARLESLYAMLLLTATKDKARGKKKRPPTSSRSVGRATTSFQLSAPSETIIS
jgi:hypothetical protein